MTKEKWVEIFGVASKSDCVMDLFFGIDYTPIWVQEGAE